MRDKIFLIVVGIVVFTITWAIVYYGSDDILFMLMGGGIIVAIVGMVQKNRKLKAQLKKVEDGSDGSKL